VDAPKILRKPNSIVILNAWQWCSKGGPGPLGPGGHLLGAAPVDRRLIFKIFNCSFLFLSKAFTVLTQWQTFGSLREELGRKRCGWKYLKFYHYFIQRMKATVQRGWFRWKCLQSASTSCLSWFEPVLSVHCLAALDLEARVEQPMDCLIIRAIYGEVDG